MSFVPYFLLIIHPIKRRWCSFSRSDAFGEHINSRDEIRRTDNTAKKMRILLFLFSFTRGEKVTAIKATKFTIGTPSCDTVPSFEYQVSTTCESDYYYEHDESCTITCSEEITMTCDCLTSDTVISFLKEDGCTWTASATCETSIQSTVVSFALETSATTMDECEDTAESLESSLSSSFEDEMGTADSLSSLTVTCEESTSRKRRSIARNRRSTTYDANVEIEITSIVEDDSDLVSVVTDTDSIEDLVSDTVTTTVEDELSDVVSVPTTGLSVEAEIADVEVVSQDSVTEVDVNDSTTTTTSTTTTITTTTTTTTTDSDSTTTTADTTTSSTSTTTTTTSTTTTTTYVVSYEDIEILENEIEVSFRIRHKTYKLHSLGVE